MASKISRPDVSSLKIASSSSFVRAIGRASAIKEPNLVCVIFQRLPSPGASRRAANAANASAIVFGLISSVLPATWILNVVST